MKLNALAAWVIAGMLGIDEDSNCGRDVESFGIESCCGSGEHCDSVHQGGSRIHEHHESFFQTAQTSTKRTGKGFGVEGLRAYFDPEPYEQLLQVLE